MRNLLLFALFLFSATTYAEDYYWYIPGKPILGNFGSALSAANSEISSRSDPDFSSQTLGATRWLGDSHFQYCVIQNYTGSSNSNNNCWNDVYRGGDSCPDSSPYNPETRGCEKPPEPEPDLCAASAGSETPFSKRGKAGDGWYTQAGNGIGATPDQACRLGCLTTLSKVHCKDSVDGSYTCTGMQYGAGVKCPDGAGGRDTEQTSDFVAPEPQTVVDKKPCIYETLANGTQQCKSESSVENEGENCGSVNGEYKCLPKAASKNGVEIATSVKTDPTADGGSKSTKTDVTTKTTCKDGKCTTSTTTRTTTTTKDADGKVKTVTGTCTGKNCTDKNEDPDGEGDGNGTCTGANCSEDPFEEGVGDGGFYEPGEDTFESVLTEFQSGVTQLPVIEGVGNFLAFNPSGSCPTGSTSVWIFTIQADQWCGNSIPWDLIRAIVMGAAAFLAFRFAFL